VTSMELFLFSLFGGMAVVSALGVVLLRDPVKGAMSLIGTFFGLACLFLIQRAELLAVLEVLVYAGAIMVLFVFVIMLVQDKDQPIVNITLRQRVLVPVKIAAVAIMAFAMLGIVDRARLPNGSVADGSEFGGAKAIGRLFLTDHLFHFELSSVLLLVGIVGAVVLSHQVKTSRGSKT
jgi:NADH-quinone oxidoreductase subunit J